MFFAKRNTRKAKKLLTSKTFCGIIYVLSENGTQKREFSSAGRASALQAEGQRFEPVNSHHESTSSEVLFLYKENHAIVAWFKKG